MTRLQLTGTKRLIHKDFVEMHEEIQFISSSFHVISFVSDIRVKWGEHMFIGPKEA